MSRVGFTTSIPVEVILAAGKTPVDLNNVFINSLSPQSMVDLAEEEGYPRNCCGWIKGLYATSLNYDMEALIAVMHGDCSNTQALMETLQLRNKKIIPFAFPFDRERSQLEAQVDKLMQFFEVDMEEVLKARARLEKIRSLCREVDRMTWRDNLVTGQENHYYLLCSSDFNGNPDSFEAELQSFVAEARKRRPIMEEVRLAYIGVPPIFTDLHQLLELMGARVVFNEVQRQFSMPVESQDIIEQYLRYTYPYGAFARLEDIEEQLAIRDVQGIIHYTQTFCFRQIEDLIFRERLKMPFLTLEGDRPGKVDARSRMRLESFVNMLKK